jgi:hypothetical protein
VIFGAITVVPLWLIARSPYSHALRIGPAILFSVFYAAFWYGVLAVALNRRKMIVTPTDLTVRTGPIRLAGLNQSTSVAEFARIYVTKNERIVSGSGIFYNLIAQNKDGTRMVITGNHDDPDIVVAIGHLIEETIGRVEMSLEIPVARTFYTTTNLGDVRRMFRPFKILLLIVGSLMILAGLVLSVRKLQHISSLTRSEGVVTGVETHSHDLGHYSFFVTYSARGRTIHAYSFTGSLAPRREGDTVTVLFDSQSLEHPDILILDDEWALYAIVAVCGAVFFIAPALWFGRKLRRKQ